MEKDSLLAKSGNIFYSISLRVFHSPPGTVTQRASEAGFDDLAQSEARAGPEESEAERDPPSRPAICLTTREAGNGPPLSTSMRGCTREGDILKFRMCIKSIYWISTTNNCT